MKKAKLTAEVLITALCLYMIYEVALKTKGGEHQLNPAIAGQLVAYNIEGMEHSQDVYEVIAKSDDPDMMRAVAKAEAERMIQTGDTEEFQKELERNRIVSGVLNDEQ